MFCDRGEKKGRPHSNAYLTLKKSLFVLNLEKLAHKIGRELLTCVKK